MKGKAYKLVAEILGCDVNELDEDAQVGITLGWDSMTYLKILLALEKEYGISIDEDSVNQYKTMRGIEALDSKKEKTCEK